MYIDGLLYVKKGKEFVNRTDANEFAAIRRSYGERARVVWRNNRHAWWVVTRLAH